MSFSIHYIDNYLTVGLAASPIVNIIKAVCKEFGVLLALEKVEGPATCLTFLGIVLDTRKMEIRLPDEKLTRIRCEVAGWLQRRTATKKQILSLVGLLQHATKVIRQGKTFVARMYKAAAKVEEISYYTRLNKEFKSNLFRWHYFLEHWNGLSLLRPVKQVILADLQIQTDASGTWGCGAVWCLHWF